MNHQPDPNHRVPTGPDDTNRAARAVVDFADQHHLPLGHLAIAAWPAKESGSMWDSQADAAVPAGTIGARVDITLRTVPALLDWLDQLTADRLWVVADAGQWKLRSRVFTSDTEWNLDADAPETWKGLTSADIDKETPRWGSQTTVAALRRNHPRLTAAPQG